MFIKHPLLEHSREEASKHCVPQALWPRCSTSSSSASPCYPLLASRYPAAPAAGGSYQLWVSPSSPVSGWALPRCCQAGWCFRSAFYWFDVFCAVLHWLLWPILNEVCLALAAVLSRSETENGPYCNINGHNGTFSTDFSRLELLCGFPSVKVKLNCVPVDEVSGFGCSGHSMRRHSDGPGQREPRSSHIPPCCLSFQGTWYKPRGTTAVCMQLPWSLLPPLLPPKLALRQPGLKLHFHPPHSDCSHGQANLWGVQIAICFSISSCFPWFSSSHCREWQTCPRAVYLTLTLTPRLRSAKMTSSCSSDLL